MRHGMDVGMMLRLCEVFTLVQAAAAGAASDEASTTAHFAFGILKRSHECLLHSRPPVFSYISLKPTCPNPESQVVGASPNHDESIFIHLAQKKGRTRGKKEKSPFRWGSCPWRPC